MKSTRFLKLFIIILLNISANANDSNSRSIVAFNPEYSRESFDPSAAIMKETNSLSQDYLFYAENASSIASHFNDMYNTIDDLGNLSASISNSKLNQNSSLQFKLPSISNISTSTAGSSLSSNKLTKKSEFKQLFRSFSFKGIALSMSKSALDLQTCGVSMKIPITSSFPFYDRLIYLPRIVLMLSLGYPASIRLQFSISLPAQVLLALSMVVFEVFRSKEKGEKLNQSLVKWPTIRATDSLKRVGLVVGCKYSKHGFQTILGALLIYIPGTRKIASWLPILLAFPAFLLGLWFIASSFCQKVGGLFCDRKDQHNNANSTLSTSNLLSDEISRVLNQMVPPMESESPLKIPSNDTLAIEQINSIDRTNNNFQQATFALDKFMSTKSPVMGSNLGWYRTGNSMNVGSSLYFDLQPFFPFKNFFKKLSSDQRRRQQESKD